MRMFVLAAVALGWVGRIPAVATDPTAPQGSPPRYHPRHVLIRPKAGLGPVSLSSWHDRCQARVLRAYPDLDDLQVLELPAGSSVPEAIRAYQRSGLVEFAEPDYYVRAAALPDDPEYQAGTLWGLNNTGQQGGVADVDIDAPEGWEMIREASQVIVAILDSGIRYTHADLAANVWINPGEIPGNHLDDDQDGVVDDVYGFDAIENSGDPWDDFGHGTHLAGILGATGNNGLGVTGVAWRVQLLACKFLDRQGNGLISDAIKCFDYARRHGARIINASWTDPDFSQSLQSAVIRARQAGIIVVTVPGNQGINVDQVPSYPAALDLDNIVVVTAVSRAGELNPFASYGPRTVDLGAPGVSVLSTYHTSDEAYLYYSGTSMAAPYVCGILALLTARFPQAEYGELIQRLLASTKPLPALAGKCVTGGMASLSRALGNPVVADFTAHPDTGALPLWVQFNNTSLGPVTSQSWDFGDGSELSSAPSPTHVFTQEGRFTVTLTVTGTNQVVGQRRRQIEVIANYVLSAAHFDWIEPTGMDPVSWRDSEVSEALPLPFSFTFYGQAYEQVYVAGNGLMGFIRQGLESSGPLSLPNPAAPNAILCPYWDQLSSSSGGRVFLGTVGQAPNRRCVVSWVEAPRRDFPETRLTFQAVLSEETQEIRFQYAEVQPDRADGGGRQAVIGLENANGTVAVQAAAFGQPMTLTNHQALVFSPTSAGGLSVRPSEDWIFYGQPGGPVYPKSQTGTLLNTSRQTLHWETRWEQDWISLVPAQGSLAPGQATNLSVTLNANAQPYIVGDYRDTITFTENQTPTRTLQRQVVLVLRLPQPARLEALGWTDDRQFKVRLYGQPGSILQLESADQLADWTPVWTNQVPLERFFDYLDTRPASLSQRNYRTLTR